MRRLVLLTLLLGLLLCGTAFAQTETAAEQPDAMPSADTAAEEAATDAGDAPADATDDAADAGDAPADATDDAADAGDAPADATDDAADAGDAPADATDDAADAGDAPADATEEAAVDEDAATDDDGMADDAAYAIPIVGVTASASSEPDVEAEPAPEAPKTCSQRCEAACGCWFKRAGGGPFVMVIFNEASTPYGNFNGPSFFFGGRGYGYVGEGDRWRIGGMGAGGFGSDDSNVYFSNHALFSGSESRSVSGGYGGLTVEYVFNAQGTVEFPLGMLIGGGGADVSADLTQKNLALEGVTTQYNKGGGFFALQPMLGVDATITDFMRANIGISYLLTEPFGSGGRYADGFGIMFGLTFGYFGVKPFPNIDEPHAGSSNGETD